MNRLPIKQKLEQCVATKCFLKNIERVLHYFVNELVPEHNLEFQGSALFMKFYPEMPWNNR